MLPVLKLVLTPLLIAAASLARRRWGHAVSGWLLGLPLTSGPVAFFLAIERGASFSLVFGAEWSAAGHYARWLAVGIYFGFINVPAVQAVSLLGLQGHVLIAGIIVCSRTHRRGAA
jgi:O-antigen/teichoic acid export membrane protein